MASQTVEQKKLAKLVKTATDLGITLGGSETAEELTAKIAEAKPAKTEKSSTVFSFKNGGSRTFSKSVHGEDWEEKADEFQETNKGIIANRDGKAL